MIIKISQISSWRMCVLWREWSWWYWWVGRSQPSLVGAAQHWSVPTSGSGHTLTQPGPALSILSLSLHQSLCSVTRCQQLAPDHRVHTVDQSWYCRVLRRQLWQRTLCWLCAGEAWYIDSSKCGHSYTKHCWSSFPRWHWCRVRAEPAGRVGPSQCWQGEPGLASS